MAEENVTNFIVKLVIKKGSSVDGNGNKEELNASLSKLIEGMDLGVLLDNQILPLLKDLNKGCFACYEHGKKDVIYKFLDAKKEKDSLQGLSPQITKGITDFWIKLNEEEEAANEEGKNEDYSISQRIWRLVVTMLNIQLESIATSKPTNGGRIHAPRESAPRGSGSANRRRWNKQSRSPPRGRNFSRSPSRWKKRTLSPTPGSPRTSGNCFGISRGVNQRSPDARYYGFSSHYGPSDVSHYGPSDESHYGPSTSSATQEDNDSGSQVL